MKYAAQNFQDLDIEFNWRAQPVCDVIIQLSNLTFSTFGLGPALSAHTSMFEVLYVANLHLRILSGMQKQNASHYQQTTRSILSKRSAEPSWVTPVCISVHEVWFGVSSCSYLYAQCWESLGHDSMESFAWPCPQRFAKAAWRYLYKVAWQYPGGSYGWGVWR